MSRDRFRDPVGWASDALPWPLRRLVIAARFRSWPPDEMRITGMRRPPNHVLEDYDRLIGDRVWPSTRQIVVEDGVAYRANGGDGVTGGIIVATDEERFDEERFGKRGEKMSAWRYYDV